MTANITDFGTTRNGETVRRVTLTGHGLAVRLLTLGATLQDLRLDGVAHALTLGGTDVAAYEGALQYCGAVVGPVANRIAGATALLDGRRLTFVANEGGATTLHGGPRGLHLRNWDIAEAGADRVTFALDLPDGEEGFPGNRHFEARFELAPERRLRMTLTATSDADTLINMANHSYWNLDGGPTIDGHRLVLDADRYNPVDDRLIPTGCLPVAGTAFDFRGGRAVGPTSGHNYDHNFCLTDGRGPLRRAARLTGAHGIAMEIWTGEPGLQVYDAARFDGTGAKGLADAPYGHFAGLAMEAQCWPDAPNRPDFPAVRLDAAERYRQETEWRFALPGT